MCDCVPSPPPPPPSLLPGNRKLASTASFPTPRARRFATRRPLTFRNPTYAGHPAAKSAGGAPGRGADFGSRDREFYGRLGLKDDGEERFELETDRGGGAGSREGSGSGGSDAAEGGNVGADMPARSGVEEEEVLLSGDGGDAGVALRREEESESKLRVRGGRQVMRRSSMVAKQVISIESALGLGFVSQLWVDIASWNVVIVEVRPNLLSGDSERFPLEDVCQVGDVVLVENERVMENELKMVGLETLVGYEVVTPGRRSIGKVRGYTFNVNSGALESLELDSFGISIIPSSLVSTYALFVEDVLEVASDKVFVHEAAAARLQRLTKGWWGAQKVGKSFNEVEEYYDLEEDGLANDRRTRREFRRRRSRPKSRENQDDLDLPMDFL
ncbi:hypothetical protein EUGRSUZ_K01292 [Eucalyptus grandis]|uniref:Uncharacterized protein n=2 Tax=Eucalyptus grandis TaxID=71139 RepID=A0ACC3IVR8_EUCGR|nr:hypothetical protein EUGRSUZ_K01292 [Eucalyptus grandis]